MANGATTAAAKLAEPTHSAARTACARFLRKVEALRNPSVSNPNRSAHASRSRSWCGGELARRLVSGSPNVLPQFLQPAGVGATAAVDK
jgi:hypothetical protein